MINETDTIVQLATVAEFEKAIAILSPAVTLSVLLVSLFVAPIPSALVKVTDGDDVVPFLLMDTISDPVALCCVEVVTYRFLIVPVIGIVN